MGSVGRGRTQEPPDPRTLSPARWGGYYLTLRCSQFLTAGRDKDKWLAGQYSGQCGWAHATLASVSLLALFTGLSGPLSNGHAGVTSPDQGARHWVHVDTLIPARGQKPKC